MRTLTRADLDAIRNSPCGTCGAVPPFPDGSRCHAHRLDPQKGYVLWNVVARCPDCHATEPGHGPWVKAATENGRVSGRKNRDRKLSPEHRAKIGAALRGRDELASKRRAAGRIGGLKNPGTKSPEHRAKIAAALRGQKHPPERRAKLLGNQNWKGAIRDAAGRFAKGGASA